MTYDICTYFNIQKHRNEQTFLKIPISHTKFAINILLSIIAYMMYIHTLHHQSSDRIHTHHKVNATTAHVRLVHQRQGRIRFVDVRCPAGDQDRGGTALIEVGMVPQAVRLLQRNRVVVRARHQDEVHGRDGGRYLWMHRFGRNCRGTCACVCVCVTMPYGCNYG